MNHNFLQLLVSMFGGDPPPDETPTRKWLNKLLEELPDKPVPEELSFGAMCYEMVSMYRSEYVCPLCGTKTILDGNYDSSLQCAMREYHNHEIRVRECSKNGIIVELDPSCWCSKCKREGEDEVMLVVTMDGRETRTPLHVDDLSMLSAFFSSESAFNTNELDVIPLVQCMPRIRQLLGLEEAP